MIELIRNEIVQRSLSVAALVALGGLSATACGSEPQPGPGYDVSHPQCSSKDPSEAINLPDARSFAIVGLNEGVAKTYNSCFEDQMKWASASAGDKGQPKASIYVNAGNPGKDGSSEWPHSGAFQDAPCTGEDTQACAFMYGKSLIDWDLDTFKDKYGKENEVKPEAYNWWIDVETSSSWECNNGLSALCAEKSAIPVESGALGRNSAVIHGMTTELQAKGIKVGIYTHPGQWMLIVDNVIEILPEYAASRGLDVWVAGASNKGQAEVACQQPPFGGLGKIVLSQYNPNPSRVLDKNVAC